MTPQLCPTSPDIFRNTLLTHSSSFLVLSTLPLLSTVFVCSLVAAPVSHLECVNGIRSVDGVVLATF